MTVIFVYKGQKSSLIQTIPPNNNFRYNYIIIQTLKKFCPGTQA